METGSNDLSKILEQLEPSVEYDKGGCKGTLALDHTSIHTEASSYETRSNTVTVTKTIGQVDRNDMFYVPATTVKNGVTLNLSGVDWQITGTDLVGDALDPASYQAVATYSGKSYYKAATGYVTTADYVGEISRDDVESVTDKEELQCQRNLRRTTYAVWRICSVRTSAISGVRMRAVPMERRRPF